MPARLAPTSALLLSGHRPCTIHLLGRLHSKKGSLRECCGQSSADLLNAGASVDNWGTPIRTWSTAVDCTQCKSSADAQTRNPEGYHRQISRQRVQQDGCASLSSMSSQPLLRGLTPDSQGQDSTCDHVNKNQLRLNASAAMKARSGHSRDAVRCSPGIWLPASQRPQSLAFQFRSPELKLKAGPGCQLDCGRTARPASRFPSRGSRLARTRLSVIPARRVQLSSKLPLAYAPLAKLLTARSR